jgi:hypothetical protein
MWDNPIGVKMTKADYITSRMTDKKVGNGQRQAIRRQPYTLCNRITNTIFTPTFILYNLIF